MSKVFRGIVFCGLTALLPLWAAGQDLGSSNKLFGAPTTKPAAKAHAKKAPVKRANSTAKAKPATAKPKPKAASTTSKLEGTTSTGRATKKPSKTETSKAIAQPERVEIRPSKPPEKRETSVPVSAAATELFEKLIEDGNLARDERNYAAAENAYERAKAIKPRDARAVYGLGNLYSDQQRWDQAETSYRAALLLDPANATVHIALSYVLSQPIFVSNLSDRYQEAEKLARRAIELAPSNALAYDQLGVSMELRGLIARETENAYRNAIRLDPTFAPAYAHLGRLLRRRGSMKESAAAYHDAVRYSNDVATMIVVADVMQSEQRFADSEPLLRKAVDDDPRNPTALLLLGRALTTMGNYTDAEQILRRSLDASPSGFMPNLLLGSLYARQSKYELAENALLQALRFVSGHEKPRLSQQFETVGDGYMKGGKARNAERAYRQALVLDPERDSIAAKLGRAQRH